MTVSAMFAVEHVQDFGTHRQVKLRAVYSSDKSSPNYSWSQATPCGEISLTITNPAAYEQFAPRKQFYLTFDEVARVEA